MDDRSLLGDVPLGKLGGAKILVVDDDEEIRIFLTTLFSDEGALVFEAEDGYQALEVAARKQPDIVTLDLSMPGKDGIDTFCDLRTNPATRNVAVCVITGHTEFRKVIYDRPVAPPEGFLNKPCEPDVVVDTVRRIFVLRKRKHARTSD
jgi:CheY-like chemotaxis protein